MNKNVELTISNTLKDLGITPALRGFGYLRHAIKLTMEDPTIVHSIVKKLYPEVAKHYDTTPTRVERSMRHAIDNAWTAPKNEVQEDIFRQTIKTYSHCPTNGMFIATVADYLLTSEEVHHGT